MVTVANPASAQELVHRYLRYLRDERRYSTATIENYQRDIRQFIQFTNIASVTDCCAVDSLQVRGFAGWRRQIGRAHV